MGTDELHAVTHFLCYADFRPFLDLVNGEVGFGLAPTLNAFEQGAGFVHRAGLACGKYVIKMQMGVAERRTDQLSTQIDDFHVCPILASRFECCFEIGRNADEFAVFNENVLNCHGVGCGAAWHAGGDVCVGEELSAHGRSFQYGFSGSGRRFVICSLGYDGEPLA